MKGEYSQDLQSDSVNIFADFSFPADYLSLHLVSVFLSLFLFRTKITAPRYGGTVVRLKLIGFKNCRTDRAARIITSSQFDTPYKPLLLSLGLKSVQEIIDFNTNSMVFKSNNGLATGYLSNLFVKNSHSTSRILRETSINLRIPMKITLNGQKGFHTGISKLGIICQLRRSRHRL